MDRLNLEKIQADAQLTAQRIENINKIISDIKNDSCPDYSSQEVKEHEDPNPKLERLGEAMKQANIALSSFQHIKVYLETVKDTNKQLSEMLQQLKDS